MSTGSNESPAAQGIWKLLNTTPRDSVRLWQKCTRGTRTAFAAGFGCHVCFLNYRTNDAWSRTSSFPVCGSARLLLASGIETCLALHAQPVCTMSKRSWGTSCCNATSPRRWRHLKCKSIRLWGWCLAMHNTTAGSHMACNIPVCILCTYVIVYMNVYMCVLEHGYIENIYIYRYTLINTYAHTHICISVCTAWDIYVFTYTRKLICMCICLCALLFWLANYRLFKSNMDTSWVDQCRQIEAKVC